MSDKRIAHHVMCLRRGWISAPPIPSELSPLGKSRALRLLLGRAVEAKNNGRHNAAGQFLAWAASLQEKSRSAARDRGQPDHPQEHR